MMFDPPDYPYKDLAEVLRDHYGPDELLFDINDPTMNCDSTNDMYNNTARSVSPNDANNNNLLPLSKRGTLNSKGINENLAFSEELVIRDQDFQNSDRLTLLDDNTINQFILPLQTVLDSCLEGLEETGNSSSLLALESCNLCDEVFTSQSDLLDHTLSVHIGESENILADDLTIPACNEVPRSNGLVDAIDPVPDYLDEEGVSSQWLVCHKCERILSTASDIELGEKICCDGLMQTRLLQTLYVCENCSFLFATNEALLLHRSQCVVTTANLLLKETEFIDKAKKESSSVYGRQLRPRRPGFNEELKSPERISEIRTRKRTVTVSSNPSKMWNCGSCNQLFITARELYKHKRGEDKNKSEASTYVCEECNKVLGSVCALHTHRKMHTVRKPGYICKLCGRRFNQSGHLAIHMRMHTGERPYPCDFCPKAFKVKVERDDHRRTHTGERPFVCGACGKTFTAAARLREHSRIHTDQRPYKCDVCGAAFRRPYARTVHTLIHTGEKPYECDLCGTAFRRSGDMWKHKRTLHGCSYDPPRS